MLEWDLKIEHWKDVYSTSGTQTWGEENGKTSYSHGHSEELVMTYKGTLKELSSLEISEYAYDTSAESGSGILDFDKPPTELHLGAGEVQEMDQSSMMMRLFR